MTLTQELHTLASFSAGALPVVSLYLNTQWRDQHQRTRMANFLTQHLRQAADIIPDTEAARQSLAGDLERLSAWGKAHLNGTATMQAPGFAVFTCSGADFWVELPTPVPFDAEFTIAPWPALRQLARLDEEHTSALVVMVDSRAARVYEVVLGGMLSETDFVNEDFPGRHKQGGWAQMRYQRHVKDQIDHHHKEVAAYLTTYITAHPQTYVILSGQNTILANFRHFLPSLVQQQIIDTVTLDIRDNRHHLLTVAQAALERHEREEEHASVERLLNGAGQGGLAVLGRQETVAAVNTGRAHMLVMNRDLRGDGWRCLACDGIGEALVDQCPTCAGQVMATELGEALVSAALRTDSLVDLVEPDARLARYEGVGVLLRYKA